MFKKFYNKKCFAFTVLLFACAAGITGCGAVAGSSVSTETASTAATEISSDVSEVTDAAETADMTEASGAAEVADLTDSSVATETTDMTEASDATETVDMTEASDTAEASSDPTAALASEAVEEMTDNSSSDFYYTSIPDSVKSRMIGVSYPADTANALISLDSLSYVHVLHVDFNGNTQTGELICNTAIAQDLVDIFKALYEAGYPIDKIRLIDEYGADDDTSMAADNTSCFNYRLVKGSNKLSNHGLGRAIDLNPLYNPCVYLKSGEIAPPAGAAYADRSADFPYKIDTNDLAYKLFTQHGFTWGGAWNSLKDYQHFEKK